MTMTAINPKQILMVFLLCYGAVAASYAQQNIPDGQEAKEYKITNTLVDPLATNATRDLYAFLISNFRKNIITGQTEGMYTQVATAAGKSPMLKAYDLLTYSPMYPYNWDNNANNGAGGHA